MRRLRPLPLLLFCLIIAAGCTRSGRLSEAGYLRFLKENMSTADARMYKDGYWTDNVHKALEVRDRMGWEIPEKEWRYFVLPVQVGDMPLDDFRTTYADTLCRRVEGMSMEEAALEVNLWCLEQAVYGDGSMDSPMGTMMRGSGECMTLSALVVSAQRAVGIPARMVQSSWLHTNGGHAWTEVWVDGKWMHMGSAEPAPVLNEAWYNDVASRCVQLPVKVFGDYRPDNETLISRGDGYTIVDALGNYAPQHTLKVSVVNARGEAVQGATVYLCIYNGGELMPVHTLTTDRKGRVEAVTGRGGLLVLARLGQSYGIAVSSGDEVEVGMLHSFSKAESYDFSLAAGDRQPDPFDADYAASLRKNFDPRVALADSIRIAAHAVPASEQAIDSLKKADLKPYIPEMTWSRRDGIKVLIRVDRTYDEKKRFSIQQFRDGALVSLTEGDCESGPMLVTSGTHLVNGLSLVHCEISSVPENVSTVQVDLHCPDVPLVQVEPLGRLSDVSFINFHEYLSLVLTILDEGEKSEHIKDGTAQIRREWVLDRSMPGWETAAKVIKSDLGMDPPCILFVNQEGYVYFTARDWDDGMLLPLSSIANSIP